MLLPATGTALAAAAGTVLALALREAHPGRAAVLAAVGSAALALAGLALGAAALEGLGRLPGAAAADAVPHPPPFAAAGTASFPDLRSAPATPKLLDTNVIIDGRVAEICETGLLEGPLIVPQFVLRELQRIADSPDALRRSRGRRGLDILARMQRRAEPTLQVSDRDFPHLREVDAKLVALATETGACIVTNDVSLNKVAELSGVTVLNINHLANALRPAALPGELLRVAVLKEGKEANQGVGYLEDGTMVVIDNARRHIGKRLEVAVTSAIQTSAGRMVFAQAVSPEAAPEEVEAAP